MVLFYKSKSGQFLFIRVVAVGLLFIALFSLALAPFITTVFNTLNFSVYGGFGNWVLSHWTFIVLIAFVLMILIALVLGLRE